VVAISIIVSFLAAVAVARFGFRGRTAFIVMVITQHQSTSGDQREAVLARCKKCKAELARHDYDATPHGLPGYDAKSYGADEDPIRQFATLYHSLKFVERCIDQGVLLDYMPYPMQTHRLVGKDKPHFQRTLKDFLDRNLKGAK